MQTKQAFTLVELIVVITILAILGTIAFMSFQGYSKSARDSVRINDINNISSALELFILKTGKYPLPDGGIDITYSGSMAWNQGIFGERVLKNVEKINTLPIDPLTGNEYTYSVLNTNKEFEVGSIIEGDNITLNKNILENTYAEKQKGFALIKGTYNGKMLKVSSGSITYVLATPSIINSDMSLTDIIQIIDQKKLVYKNYNNLPDSYNNSSFEINGGFDFDPNNILIYTGDLNDLNDDVTKQITLIKKLQEAYSGTILESDTDLQDLTSITIDLNNPSTELKILAGNIINNNLKQKVTIYGESNNIINPFTSGWTLFTVADGLGENDSTDLVEDSSGNKWVGSRGGGVSKYNGTLWENYNKINDNLVDDNIFGLFNDSNNNMWFANWGGAGLGKFINSTTPGIIYNQTNSDLPCNWLQVIGEFNGSIYVGTDCGLAKFDGTSTTGWTIFNTGNSDLPDNEVYDMYIDSSTNTIWIGTKGGGLAKFDGTSSTGWIIFNTGNSDLTNDIINTVYKDSMNNIWSGTYGGGLMKFDGTSSTGWTIFNTGNSDIPSNYVGDIFEDSLGNIWVGTSLGVAKFDGISTTGWTIFNTGNSGIGTNYVETFFEDDYNNIWMTTGAGVNVYNPN